MHAGLVSHCRQQYAGRFEILFGVSSLQDPAVAEIERLCAEFPDCDLRLIVCPLRLGTSGKVSNLIQMLRQTRHRPRPDQRQRHPRLAALPDAGDGLFLRREQVGMVTAPYLGRTAADGEALTLWARLEALGISTDFMPGVLTARMLEGRHPLRAGIDAGGLARGAGEGRRTGAAGGLPGRRLRTRRAHRRAGYRIELCGETVETTVPAYDFRGFWDHQLRWARSTRDSRRWGYVGLGITYCVPWAVLNCVAAALRCGALLC